MKTLNRLTTLAVAFVLLVTATAFPQGQANNSGIRTNDNFRTAGGLVKARDYANWQFQQQTATAAGAVTFVVSPPGTYQSPAQTNSCIVQFNNGRKGIPLAAGVSLQTYDGSSAETVAITSVTTTNGICTVTITWANAHGAGTLIGSGDYGLTTAIQNLSVVGGVVEVDPDWLGTTAQIQATTNPVFSNVFVVDTRQGWQPYAAIPSTLTALATPATRSATAGATQVISGTATGTWAASAYFVCVTYVDILGGESPCSGSFSFTATASVALNYASPAASTGAVGWRAYAGLSGTSTQYQLAITSSTCTLSTLETLYPACAIGSAGVFPTPVTTTSLAPGQVTAVYRPNTISHTTFIYGPVPALPTFSSSSASAFEQDFGPFVATVGGTTGQVQVLGTVALPPGYINNIHKSITVWGHITMTAGTSETPVLRVQLGPTWTTGTPTDICKYANTTALSAAVYTLNFTCTITANATGTSGTVMPFGLAEVALGAGTTAGTVLPELGTAAITSNLAALNGNGNLLFVTYIPTSGTDTAVQLLDLHIRN